MEIKCKFGHRIGGYGCAIESKEIPLDQELKIVGKHINGKTNSDVTHIGFSSCVMYKIPKGLTKTFPNLKFLDIFMSNLTEICQEDLAEYKQLEDLSLNDVRTEYLPGDLLKGFKKLKEFYFLGCNLKRIDPDIFDGLDSIERITIRGNRKFYTSYWKDHQTTEDRVDYLNVFSMDHLKLKLIDAYSDSTKEELLLDLIGSEKALKIENQQLKEENLEHLKTIRKYQESFFSDLNACFQDETTKDFKVIIGNHQFDVHKLLLIARSPTFAEILKNNHEIHSLDLADISVEIFEKILKFFYTNELPDAEQTNMLQLYAASGKLKIKNLIEYAETKLMDIVDERNAFEVLKLSCLYNHVGLQQKSFNLLKVMYPDYNLEDSWSNNYEFVINYMMLVKENESRIKELKEKFKTHLMIENEAE